MFKRAKKYIAKFIETILLDRYDKSAYHSQYGQDYYILRHFNFKKEGFFIDIGAFDGVTFSNTKSLEDLGWKGICIEPNPDMYEKVCSSRKCVSYNVALTQKEEEKDFVKIQGACAVLSGIKEEYHPSHIERIKTEINKVGGNIDTIKVKGITFDSLMADFQDINTIDYISIDTEGNEFKILKSIDFSKYDIRVLSIENNYKDPEIQRFMKNAGYKCAIRLGCDEIYIKNCF